MPIFTFNILSLSKISVIFFINLPINFSILDFLTLMIYGMAAEKISIWLKSKPKVLNTISACVLLIIALYVAATQNFS